MCSMDFRRSSVPFSSLLSSARGGEQHDGHRDIQYSYFCEIDPSHFPFHMGTRLCDLRQSDWEERCRDYLETYSTQYPLLSDRSGNGSVRHCHLSRGGPELFGFRHSTPPCELGEDASGGPNLYGNFSMAGDFPRMCHRPSCIGIQSPRRWVKRYA